MIRFIPLKHRSEAPTLLDRERQRKDIVACNRFKVAGSP